MNYKEKYIKIGVSILVLIWIISFGVFYNKKINGYKGCNHLLETNINYGQGIYLYVKQSPYINDKRITKDSLPIKFNKGDLSLKAIPRKYNNPKEYDIRKINL